MKSAIKVANQVIDKYRYDRQYPVGVAQRKVLSALGIENCNSHGHAQQIFDALGITVSSERVGRESVPVVIVNDGGSQRNAGGDYDVWNSSENIDLSAISEWMN